TVCGHKLNTNVDIPLETVDMTGFWRFFISIFKCLKVCKSIKKFAPICAKIGVFKKICAIFAPKISRFYQE
ncbi:hypothetical protein, partial [Weissella confusa]|uniref:hypothetical protein n=1 Tax=Weissella confusa TaxID=1583 RepID=UPI0022FE1E25